MFQQQQQQKKNPLSSLPPTAASHQRQPGLTDNPDQPHLTSISVKNNKLASLCARPLRQPAIL